MPTTKAATQAWFPPHPIVDFLHDVDLNIVFPLVFHYDGAEAYTNQEAHVWSVGSIFSDGGVIDRKFLCCIMMNKLIPTSRLQALAHDTLVRFFEWSLSAGLRGMYPTHDLYNQPCSGSYRARRAGTLIGTD